MQVAIDMGTASGGNATLDLEELLATRLLVQGNSGSGKSHLLRRLLEQSAPWVQQCIIDPEGDFVSLSDAFGHVSIDAADYSLIEIARIAARIREHRASVVLNLEGLEMEEQMRCVAAFLGALFEAPREQWYPALVVVDHRVGRARIRASPRASPTTPRRPKQRQSGVKPACRPGTVIFTAVRSHP